MAYGTHPFVAMVGDDQQPTDYCQNCGQHRRAHEPPPKPPAPPKPVPAVRKPLGPDGRPVLTMAEVAVLAGVKESSIRVYHSQRLMPPPDGRLRNVPYWREEKILTWLASRPGRKGNPAWYKGMPSPGPRGVKK